MKCKIKNCKCFNNVKVKSKTLKRLRKFKKGYGCKTMDETINHALNRWDFD